MRHVVVRRSAVLVGGACLAWVAIFPSLVDDDRPVTAEPSASLASPPGPAVPTVQTVESGDVLYARHCASCHEVADLRDTAEQGVDATRRAALEAFLAGHGGATADENRRILDFLAGVGPGGAPGR